MQSFRERTSAKMDMEAGMDLDAAVGVRPAVKTDNMCGGMAV